MLLLSVSLFVKQIFNWKIINFNICAVVTVFHWKSCCVLTPFSMHFTMKPFQIVKCTATSRTLGTLIWIFCLVPQIPFRMNVKLEHTVCITVHFLHRFIGGIAMEVTGSDSMLRCIEHAITLGSCNVFRQYFVSITESDSVENLKGISITYFSRATARKRSSFYRVICRCEDIVAEIFVFPLCCTLKQMELFETCKYLIKMNCSKTQWTSPNSIVSSNGACLIVPLKERKSHNIPLYLQWWILAKVCNISA